MNPAWWLLARVVLMAFAMVAIVWLSVWLLGATFRAVGWIAGTVGGVVGRVVRFVGSEARDLFASLGSIASSAVYLALVLVNGVLGRPRTVAFYARALETEVGLLGRSLYAVTIGNLARAFGVKTAAFGVGLDTRDRWTPGAAPASTRHAFDGYRIVGDLPAGGSGAQLLVAEPDAVKREQLGTPVERVVIKVFSARDGSTLPQIVRESRSLEAARRLGLVLDHALEDDRFYYVMPYVPGEDLTRVTEAMHAASGEAGLDLPHLRRALRYTGSLLRTLASFHDNGLWHKDVKPSNIIVSNADDPERSEAHLVDLGLLTPLRSTMTLTTHGTEYFRDPELVRMAMRGVKVSEVPGTKFDVYGAGAVLFAMLENSFPAHGGLSQISKRCPEAVRWIVRRAMTGLENRYETADAMLLDVRAVLEAEDPFALRPADLPSMNERARAALEATWARRDAGTPRLDEVAASGAAAGSGAGDGPRRRVNPFASLLKAAVLMLGLGVAGAVAAVVVFVLAPPDGGGHTEIEVLPASASRTFTIDEHGVREVGSEQRASAPSAPAAEPTPRLPGKLVRYDTTTIRFEGAVERPRAARGIGDRGNILVVDDLPADAVATRQQVRGVLGALERRDFTVLGLGDTADDLDLVARVRRGIGARVTTAEDVAAAQRLAEILHTGLPPSVDTILWIGRDATGDGVASLLVGHRDFTQLDVVAGMLDGR